MRYIYTKGKIILTAIAFLFLLISLSLIIICRHQETSLITRQELEEHGLSSPQSSILRQTNYQFPDEVNTFLAPKTNVTKTVQFEENWMYSIYVEIVTPHNCSMKIDIIEIEGDERIYEIFENNMSYDYDYMRYYEIPFGVAFTGMYNVTFSVESDENINIYIQIEQTVPCLHDKMDIEAIQNIIFHEVFVFDKVDNGERVDYSINLEDGMMYNIYIGRVSPISKEIAKEKPYLVKMTLEIQDPNNVNFLFYSDHEMAGVDDVDKSFFGTSLNGLHSFNITINCEVEHANIALVVVKDYQISEKSEDTNTTTSTNSTISSDDSNSNEKKSLDPEKNTTSSENSTDTTVSLPQELTVGTMATVGGTLGTMVLSLVNHRKKKEIQANL